MALSWKLETNSKASRFALKIGDVRLPFFSHQEAIKIIDCLVWRGETLGSPLPVVVRHKGETLQIRPGIFDTFISVHKNADHGGFDAAHFQQSISKLDAVEISKAIGLRMAKNDVRQGGGIVVATRF